MACIHCRRGGGIMKNEDRYLDIILFVTILLLPYTVIKSNIFSKLFMSMGAMPSVILASLFTIYLFRFYNTRCIMKWPLIHLCIIVFCSLISFYNGINNFEFPELITTALNDESKNFVQFLNRYGADITERTLSIFILMYKAIFKNCIIEYFITFMVSFAISFLFYRRWMIAILICKKAFRFLSIIFSLYIILEIGYLKGYELPTKILMGLNPYLYSISHSGTSAWPPLLWGDRMRSIFAEPSYCAIFLSSFAPLLIIENSNDKKANITDALILYVLMFLIFGTDSKTALVLIGALIVYFLFMGIYFKEQLIKKSIVYIAISFSAFISYFSIVKIPAIVPAENPSIQYSIIKDISKEMNILINTLPAKQYTSKNNTNNNNSLAKSETHMYFDKNIKNITNVNYGSNTSRYGIALSEFRIFKSRPIFGAGSIELMQPYIFKFMPDFANNLEIKLWTDFSWKKGVLSIRLPILNFYTNQLASKGILFFIVYYLPLIFFCYICVFYSNYLSIKEKISVSSIIMGMLCILISGMSATLNLFFTFWIYLGIIGSIAISILKKKHIA